MTRKEEREQASNIVFKIRLCPRTAFIRGAEWSDRHPRKGLWDKEKVTEWLEDHVREFKYHDSDFADGNIDVDGLIETLVKAMEE